MGSRQNRLSRFGQLVVIRWFWPEKASERFVLTPSEESSLVACFFFLDVLPIMSIHDSENTDIDTTHVKIVQKPL